MISICPKKIPKNLFVFVTLLTLFLLNTGKGWSINSADSIKTSDLTDYAGENLIENRESGFEEFSDNTKALGDHEFTEFTGTEESVSHRCQENGKCKVKSENFTLVIAILILTILAGFMVKYQVTRNLRGLFLIASVIYLGFYKGACPCPISSFQNVILAGLGESVPWQGMIWFLGLIPVSYLVGRAYCGWICHLGALQEILHVPGKIHILQGDRAQKTLRIIRVAILTTLIIQLVITRTNIFKHYDPFKVAFNLMASNTLSWVLLGILLVSSIFIFRPFCKAVCPIGLILGWINKIPGARVIGTKGSCTRCKTCDTTCQIRAITRDSKFSRIDNQECIVCGNCIGNCRKEALSFFRNDKKNHHDKVSCTSVNPC